MNTTINCVLCFLTVAVTVTPGFNEATSTEKPSIRKERSPQGSITDAILGANIQFMGQAARSGQPVLESKLSAARAIIEAGSDMIAAKVQAARDMAGVALNGGNVIAGNLLGTISETADGLTIALGYPAEISRRRRDSDKQRDDEDDDKNRDEYEDDDDESRWKNTGDDGDEKSGGKDTNDDDDEKSVKQDEKDNDDHKSRKDEQDDGDDKSKKRGKKDDRRKTDAAEENIGVRHRRSLNPDMGRSDPDGFQTTGLIGSPCMGCTTEVMSRTVALKGGAIGGVVGILGGKRVGSGVGGGLAGVGVGAGLVGGISGGLGEKAGAGGGLVGGLGGRAGAGSGMGGGTGAGAGLIGSKFAGIAGGGTGGGKVVGIGGAVGGGVKVVGRRKREARRFGGGRSRFLPARGGAPKKGQSDTSSGSESSGGSSARLRQKRAIIDHVLQDLRRNRRQDTTPAMGNGGKTHCFSFHSLEEDEAEKKFWESFHNMMNEHDKDWNFDFESEMCGTGGGSTGAVSTNTVEGAREATTPLPPTIDA